MPCGGRFNLLGGVFEALEGARQQDRTVTAPKGQIQCPKCKKELSDGFTWCPRCGTRLVPYPCEYCGTTVPKDAQTCPGCGAPVR